jgi:thioredoxin reductase (NADPH)
MDTLYDLIILGAGPAGLTAALYAGRGRLNALLIESGADGGQIVNSGEIENYPGSPPEGETGAALVARMTEQVKRFGVARQKDAIKSADLTGEVKTLTGGKGVYRAKSVIIATGAKPRPIGCEGEKDFVGRGVSYCATCDGPFFRGLPVYVVGGGDSAVEEAVYLTRFAKSVTVIHRRDTLRAARSIQEKAFANDKIDFLWNTVVAAVSGDAALSALTVRNVQTGEERTIQPEEGMLGLFGFTGHDPNTGFLGGQLALSNGYIPTDEDCATALPGVFAAGDVRVKKLRQVVTAAADGAIAEAAAERYLTEAKP